MNENVGASFGLSVLTVVFFAVVLYQPDHPPPPAPSPVVAPAEPADARPPGPAADPPPAVDPPPAAKSAAQRGTEGPVTIKTPESPKPLRAPEPDEVRGEFTRVREGETLADVAGRVYGSAEAAETLWLANRDQLDRPDSLVPPGSILRTP